MNTKLIGIAAGLSALCYAHYSAAQGLSLKEYQLGAPMTECTVDTLSKRDDGKKLYCTMGPTTLANTPVQGVTLSIYEGRLVGALFTMGRGNSTAYGQIRDALTEKLGQPSISKPHINDFTWRQGDQLIALDGWKGIVLLMDAGAESRARKEKAQANKSDL